MKMAKLSGLKFSLALMVFACVLPAIVRGDPPINENGNNTNINVNSGQTIESNTNAPAIQLGDGQIDNDGTVINSTGNGELAIQIGNGATINNLANGNITGRIELQANENRSSVVNNQGTINGLIEFNTVGAAPGQVISSGTINGFANEAIRFGGATNDFVQLQSNSNTSGSIDMGDHTVNGDDDDDRVEIQADATLTANQNAITLVGGRVINAGSITAGSFGITFEDSNSNVFSPRSVLNTGSINSNGIAISDVSGSQVDTTIQNDGQISGTDSNGSIFVGRGNINANASVVQIENGLADNNNNGNSSNSNARIDGAGGIGVYGNAEAVVTNRGTIATTGGDGIRIQSANGYGALNHFVTNTGNINSNFNANGTSAITIAHSSLGDDDDTEGYTANANVRNSGSITGASGVTIANHLNSNVINEAGGIITATRNANSCSNSNDGGGAAIFIDHSANSNLGTVHEIVNDGVLQAGLSQGVTALINTRDNSNFSLRNGLAILPNVILPPAPSNGTITGAGGVLVAGHVNTDIRNGGLIEGTFGSPSFGDERERAGLGVGVSVLQDTGDGTTEHFLENTGSITGALAGAVYQTRDSVSGSFVSVRNGLDLGPAALPEDLNVALIEGGFFGLGFGQISSETENRGTIRGGIAGIYYAGEGQASGTVTHTLENSGLIESPGEAGIVAQFDGDLDNRLVVTNTGDIAGSQVGIGVLGSAQVSITNSGNITASGDDDDDDDDAGIVIQTGRAAAVEHSIVNNAGGVISGGAGYGILANVSTGNQSTVTVLNSGTIEGSQGGISAGLFRTSVEIQNTGIVSSNSGPAIALSQGDDDDDDDTSTAHIVNSGSILATGEGIAIDSNVLGDVDITSTGIISSAGFYSIATGEGNDTVTLGEGSDTTGGLQLGVGNNTVTMTGNGILRGNIDNAGEINKTGSGYFTWQGAANFEGSIDLNVEGGTLEIAPGVQTVDPLALNPQVLANTDEILNVDTVVSNGATLLVQDGMRLSVNNLDVDGPGSQLIIGSGGAGAQVDDGDGAQETTASFTNGASFTVNQNSDLLVRDLQMENSTGIVAGSATVTDSLFMENSNIRVTSTGSFEALNDTTLINSSLTVDEGGFISSADAIQYNNSAVVINGTQGGSIILGSGSRLGGSGTITGDATLQSGSTLAPGNSPGTLNVGGDLTLLAGTTTEIELAPTANDRVNVGGVATLGGTLRVIEFASLAGLRGTTVFTIIDAPNNAIQGAFADIQGLQLSPVVRLQAVQNTNSFQLILTRNAYADFQRSENENNLALNLDLIQATSGSGLVGLTSALDAQASAAAVANALDQIHAEPFDVLPNIAFQHQQQYASQMEQYLYTARLNLERQNVAASGAPATVQTKISAATPAVANGSVVPDYGTHNSLFTDPKSQYGGFGYAYSTESEQNTQRNGLGQTLRSGSETHDRGIQAGVDKRINENLVLGVSFGTGDVTSDLRDGRGRFDGDQYQLGVYGTWARDGGYVDALLTYNNYDFNSLRAVNFTGFNNVLRATQDVTALSGYIGGGWMSHHTGSWNWGPTASLQFTNADLDGFTETGGVAALSVSGRTVDSMRSQFGVRATRKYDFGKDRQVIPELRARWSHEFANDDRNIVAGFVATPGIIPFTSVAADPDRDTFFLGGSVNGYFAKNFSGFVNYDAEVGRQGGTLHAGRGGLTFKF